MSGVQIDNLVKGQNLRTVKTLREKNYNKYSLSVDDRNKNYLITSNKAAHFSSKNIIIIRYIIDILIYYCIC